MSMTLNEISRKLFRNNRKQYGLFFFSIVFSLAMTGAYGVLQYSPTVTDVLIDGGSTQTISQAMYFGSMLGILVFLVYADSLFLKYKSREIGIFLSLGISRRNVQKIVVREYTLLFQIAASAGLLLSVPLAYFCWSFLNLFLETQETAFSIGWQGLCIAFIFSVLSWMILRAVNCSYIKKLDILKILKTSDENEKAADGNLPKLILGALLVPGGIAAFFTLQNIGGLLNTLLAYVSLAAAVLGVYILIIQCSSIGDILKKYNIRAYYRNIVFYNLLKQKIRQYTRSIFAATLLITFTTFGIGFIAAGFIDGYNTALNEPYDYTIHTTYEHPMTEQRICEIAEESNTSITETARIDSLLVGVQNTYKTGETDWSSRIVVSESSFNSLSGEDITVSRGSFTVYYDSIMEYKLNAFSADKSLFYNPTTRQEFSLVQNEPVCRNGLFNTRSIFSSFLILNDEDYSLLSDLLENQYKTVSYMINVTDWRSTSDFQNNILQAIVSDNNGEIFTNWHNSAAFSKTGGHAEYLPYEGNETRVARLTVLCWCPGLSILMKQCGSSAVYVALY